MRPTRRSRRLRLWAGLIALLVAAPSMQSADRQGVTISGRLVGPDDRPLQSGAVVMLPVGDSFASHSAGDVQLLSDGSFSFRDVGPGAYQIRARAQTAPTAVMLFAGYRVHVGRSDILGIRLVLRPGAIVTGHVEAAPGGPAAPDLLATRVRAPFADGGSFADALTGLVHKNNTFTVAGVMEGEHYLAVEGLPEPWVMTHAFWRGADLANDPFTADSGGRIDGVRIVVSATANEIRGVVRDSAGVVAPNARVFISPPVYTSWLGGSRRFVRISADASGHYRHRGLPPGEYRVQAFRDALSVPPDKADGVLVRFDAPGIREVDLRLGPSAAMAAAAR